MTNRTNRRNLFHALLIGSALFSSSALIGAHTARADGPPALIISNEPLPPALQNAIYSQPTRAPTITPAEVTGASYSKNTQITVVGKKVDSLRGDLFEAQKKVADQSEKLAAIEMKNRQEAADYYASVATINTQLQSGTTPGNPRLMQKLGVARENLEKLSGNIATLNDLAMDISNNASVISYLMESTRAAYGLTGGVEEDHVRLAQLEDAINNTMVVIDRMLNNANDDITRTSAYLGSERNNLRTLGLAIRTGDLFGKSLSSRPFSHAEPANVPQNAGIAGATTPDDMGTATTASSNTQGQQKPLPPLSQARPLVKIRFDHANVAYEQPVYMAVNEALSRYPNARFELVAVHPSKGNAAEIAIESTRSRRNAERVLRSLNEMGLPLDRVDLSYMPSDDATSNEVRLYVR